MITIIDSLLYIDRCVHNAQATVTRKPASEQFHVLLENMAENSFSGDTFIQVIISPLNLTFKTQLTSYYPPRPFCAPCWLQPRLGGRLHQHGQSHPIGALFSSTSPIGASERETMTAL